jgi:hypothetical protein
MFQSQLLRKLPWRLAEIVSACCCIHGCWRKANHAGFTDTLTASQCHNTYVLTDGTDYFRVADHPEVGQTSQYKRVYREQCANPEALLHSSLPVIR